jgi:hypothetical protein
MVSTAGTGLVSEGRTDPEQPPCAADGEPFLARSKRETAVRAVMPLMLRGLPRAIETWEIVSEPPTRPQNKGFQSPTLSHGFGKHLNGLVGPPGLLAALRPALRAGAWRRRSLASLARCSRRTRGSRPRKCRTSQPRHCKGVPTVWWGRQDSNLEPRDYENLL